MVKFLHAADIHLDSPSRGLERYEGAPVDRIRGASRRAFERMVDLAVAERVDFVLIAGDLYDGDWKDYNTGLFLTKTLSRLTEAKIPVITITGNHDAASQITKSLRLPENVRMLATDRPDTERIEDCDVMIHGQGFAKRAVTDDLSANYPKPDPGCLNIGLLHTCADGADGHEPYAPCSIDGLRGKDYDYWALGHVHRRRELHHDPPIHFPGNLQGRHVREPGPKGCLIVEAEPGEQPQVTFHRLDVLCWETCAINVADLTDDDDLIDRVAEQLRSLVESEDEEDRLLAVRVRLQGASVLHDRLKAHPQRWLEEVRNQALTLADDRLWIEQLKIETERPVRSRSLDDGPLQVLLGLIDELRADPDRLVELAQSLPALKTLKNKLPGDLARDDEPLDLTDPNWLAAVLDRVEPLLIQELNTKLDERTEADR